MPELPEVETVRRGLAQWLPQKKITDVIVRHPRATNSRSIAPLTALNGARVLDVKRRGKFLWFTLNRPYVLMAHLGMSGQFLIESKKKNPSPHTRVQIMTTDRRNELRFIDQRTFGWLALDHCVGEQPQSIAHIALDIFEPGFDEDYVIEAMRSRKTTIKNVLLNQEIMSGVGNIYADESLWRAGIHPERIAATVSKNSVKELLTSVRNVLEEALVAGGTSFDDLYINVNGESGYFDVDLAVYGRAGEPCPRCGGAIKRIAFANRSSHFCPRCQPPSRRNLSGKRSKSGKRTRHHR